MTAPPLTTELRTCTDPHEWAEMTHGFRDHNIYQTWCFGEHRAADMRAEVVRLAVCREDVLIGLAQARIKRIPILGGGIAHIYRGPLCRRTGERPDDLVAVLTALRDLLVAGDRLHLRVHPHLFGMRPNTDVRRAFAEAGFRTDESNESGSTAMVDLEPPPEELRTNLCQKWRNCLNQSLKHDLSIVATHGMDAWRRFEVLYDEMRARKRFETGVSVHSFGQLQRALPDTEKQAILLAYAGGQPIAGHVSSLLGDTCIYLHGASNEEGRRRKAAYLLQWQAMVRARNAGARWYDLGGIDPAGNPGVHRFKSGLNGTDVSFPGPFLAVPEGSTRYLLPLAERAYRAIEPIRRARNLMARHDA